MPNSVSSEGTDEFARANGAFETTHWSMVLDAAQDQNSSKARTATRRKCSDI
jgi:hypothetical protein